MQLIKDSWQNKDYQDLVTYLGSLSEASYKKFNCQLITGKSVFLGIRVPLLKQVAKEIAHGNITSFLDLAKGDMHEEILLEGLVLSFAKLNIGQFLHYLELYSLKINNWANCDLAATNLKLIKKYPRETWIFLESLLESSNFWQQRFAFIIMLSYYLNQDFLELVLRRTIEFDSNQYYVQMAQAWLLATALAKQRDLTWSYLEKKNLNSATFKMLVGKTRDSLRISAIDKQLILQIMK